MVANTAAAAFAWMISLTLGQCAAPQYDDQCLASLLGEIGGMKTSRLLINGKVPTRRMIGGDAPWLPFICEENACSGQLAVPGAVLGRSRTFVIGSDRDEHSVFA